MTRFLVVLLVLLSIPFGSSVPALAASTGVALQEPYTSGHPGVEVLADGSVLVGDQVGPRGFVDLKRFVPETGRLETLFTMPVADTVAAGTGFLLVRGGGAGCPSPSCAVDVVYYAGTDLRTPSRTLLDCRSGTCDECAAPAAEVVADAGNALIVGRCGGSSETSSTAVVHDLVTGREMPVTLQWGAGVRIAGRYLSEVNPVSSGTIDGRVIDWETGEVVRAVEGNTPSGMSVSYELLPDGTLIYTGREDRVFRLGPGDVDPVALPVTGRVLAATANQIVTAGVRVWRPDGTLIDEGPAFEAFNGTRIAYREQPCQVTPPRLQVWEVGTGPPPSPPRCDGPVPFVLELRRSRPAERPALGPSKARVLMTCPATSVSGCYGRTSMVLRYGPWRPPEAQVLLKPGQNRWFKVGYGAPLARCRRLGRHPTLQLEIDSGLTQRPRVPVRGYC